MAMRTLRNRFILSHLLPILVIILLMGVSLAYGLWQARILRWQRNGEPVTEMRDDLLIGFLVLAAFALVAFLTYALLSIRL